MTTGNILATLIKWIILAIGVWAAAGLLDGIDTGGWQSTFAVAAVLGLLNVYLKPALLFITLPVRCLTLGLFVLVVNAALLGLASWISGVFGVDFHVDGIIAALFGGLIISLVSMLLTYIIKPDDIARDLTRG